MNLLADEGIDRSIVARLRHEGHDVISVAELAPSITDDEVLQRANDEGALLITADRDFGELVFRLGRVHTGVVLLRLSGLPTPAKADVVSEAFRDHAGEFAGAFSLISPGIVRIRRAPRA